MGRGGLLLLAALASMLGLGSLPIAAKEPPLLPLLEREPGLKKLIRLVEGSLSHRFKHGCRLKHGNASTPSTAPLCLEEWMLHPQDLMRSFREYSEEAIRYTPRGFGTMKARNLGRTYPYLSGGVFRSMGDAMQETFTHHNWYKTGTGRKAHSHAGHIANRSLVYWNLNQFKSDIVELKTRLEKKQITNHFFIVTHNQDRPGYPDWLLDHPLVLKVFGHHVPFDQQHPKLVPIPLGVANPTKPPELLHKMRLKAKTGFYNSTPIHLLLSRFRVDLGSLRPLVAASIKLNFRNLSTAKLSKEQFFAELARTKFIVSPPGVGFESSKATEAHYMGRVALISHLFRNDSLLGLPVITAWDWDAITPARLERTWAELMADPVRRYNLNKMWAPWWLAFVLKQCLLVP